MDYAHLPNPNIIRDTLKSVVQIVALNKGLLGNYSSAWTGSGTIVDKRGYILTNCHVANPRAMGMPAPDANILGVAVTNRSDEPPALTYRAEIVAQSPQLDLAVLKITSDINGRTVSRLDLPFIPIGDSDELEIGDVMAIFGYPGIGGETVTFTSGSVAGFTKEKTVNVSRAWIKTDATIAGGNSGGTSVNQAGQLVGVPTQAAAGAGITPVDARPVVDTNRDGRIDQRDTPMAIGGFINGLRPVNLAKPLLKQAGVSVSGAGSRTKIPTAPVPTKPQATEDLRRRIGGKRKNAGTTGGSKSGTRGGTTTPSPAAEPSAGASFGNLVFSSRVTKDGRAINPTAVMPPGSKQIFLTFDFEGMRTGTAWGQTWALNDKVVLEDNGKWADGSSGRKTIALNNSRNLPEGSYHVILTIRDQIAAEGEVVVGRVVQDTDTEISGQIVDESTGRGISGALVIALKPHVRVMDFVNTQDKTMAFTSAKTDRDGKFTFGKQLPKGQAYSVVVVARGYQDLVVESLLRVSATAPEQAMLNALPLKKE